MIPLPDDVMSVGVVGTQTFFKERKANLEHCSRAPWRMTPSLAAHMKNAGAARSADSVCRLLI